MEKFVENIFHGVSSIFPHTYIHFPSTSPLRYIARIESMSVTRNLHFPGKYTEEGGIGGWLMRWGGEKERRVERSSASFSLFPLSTIGTNGWRGTKGLGGNSEHSFLTDLTGQNDSLGRTSIDEQLISYDLSRFRDFDGRIVDLGTIHYVFWVIFCAWQIRRNQIRVDRSG